MREQLQGFWLPQAFVEDQVQVHLVGLGGTGGEMLDGLVRIHQVITEMGHPGLDIHLWDFDEVSVSNVGRTRFSPVDVGQNKAQVLAARYNAFYGMEIEAHPQAFEIEDHHPLFRQGGILIGCTDSAKFRLDFQKVFERIDGHSQPVLWLDLGNEDSTGQYVLGAKGRVNIELPSVADLFGRQLEQVASRKEENTPTCSLLEAVEIQSLFINRMMATWAASLLYDLFKQGRIDTHGGFVDLTTGQHRPLLIDERVWRFMAA